MLDKVLFRYWVAVQDVQRHRDCVEAVELRAIVNRSLVDRIVGTNKALSRPVTALAHQYRGVLATSIDESPVCPECSTVFNRSDRDEFKFGVTRDP